MRGVESGREKRTKRERKKNAKKKLLKKLPPLTGSQRLVKRNKLHAQSRGLGLRGVRVVGHDVESQPLPAPADLGPDFAKPDDRERLADHRHSDELGALPLALLDARVGLRDVARDGREQRDAVLGGRDRVGRRRVDDEAAGGRRGLEVDVVDADAGAADDLQTAARRGKHVGGDLGRGADDERVGGLDLFVELLGREAERDVDVAEGLELGQAWKEFEREEERKVKSECGKVRRESRSVALVVAAAVFFLLLL